MQIKNISMLSSKMSSTNLLDQKLQKIKQRQQCKTLSENEILLSTYESEYQACQKCINNRNQICELKEEIASLKKQNEILKIEKDIVLQKEQQTIKSLTQEIQQTKLQQRRQSAQIQKQFEGFICDTRTQKNLQIALQNKNQEIDQLKLQLDQMQHNTQEYTNLLHQQYEYQLSINIQFVRLKQSIFQLQQMIQRYLQLNNCIQNSTQPNVDLLLDKTEKPLEFANLSEMQHQLQQIHLSNLVYCQMLVDQSSRSLQDEIAKSQKLLIEDIVRCI